MNTRILKFYLIGMILFGSLVSPECKKKERKVFTLPPITVKAKQSSFWYEDKKIKTDQSAKQGKYLKQLRVPSCEL